MNQELREVGEQLCQSHLASLTLLLNRVECEAESLRHFWNDLGVTEAAPTEEMNALLEAVDNFKQSTRWGV